LVGVGHAYLENIIKNLREHGLEERVHGNTSRTSKNLDRIEVNYNIACDIYEFLKNYYNIYGMPSPGWQCTEISMPIVFLLISYNYALVYHDYVQAYKDKHGKNVRVMAKLTFINFWKVLIPSLQFMSQKSDLCETCEIIKLDLQHT
ncbi:14756_t:CDS:1, partial [Gigaspora rosea]